MDRRSSAPPASLSTNLKAVRFSGQSDGGDGIQSTKRTLFKDTTTIRWIKSLGEMSKEEKSLLWYTPDDLNNIRKDTRKTVKAYRRLVASLPADDLLSEDSQQPMPRRFSEGDADDVEMCIRGLEHLTCKSTLLSLVKEKSSVVQAVLSLHRNRQPPPMELAEVVDRPATTEARLKSILLAMRYSALTRVASERAQRAAGDDEAEAYD